MTLKRFTITGADDGVSWNKLIELSEQYPFVEWGILLSASRETTRRYPGYEWRRLFAAARAEASFPVATALHVCGTTSREIIAGETDWPDPWNYGRVQLNGFSSYRVPLLRFARAHSDHEIILQVQTQSALVHAAELVEEMHPNVSVLIDESGGRGTETMVWRTIPEVLHGRCGHAGGITRDNIVTRLSAVEKIGAVYTWADAESGARTNDQFDVDKVKRMLDLAEPFMVKV